MAVHSAQLAIASVSTSTGTYYTVPSGVRTILKSIIANNNHNAANNISVYVYSSGGTLIHIQTIYMAADGSNGDTVYESPWLVLNAGETLRAAAQFATVYLALSGTELDL